MQPSDAFHVSKCIVAGVSLRKLTALPNSPEYFAAKGKAAEREGGNGRQENRKEGKKGKREIKNTPPSKKIIPGYSMGGLCICLTKLKYY